MSTTKRLSKENRCKYLKAANWMPTAKPEDCLIFWNDGMHDVRYYNEWNERLLKENKNIKQCLIH